MSARQSITGVVRDYECANPHIYIYVETTDAAGDSRLREVEGGALSMMRCNLDNARRFLRDATGE